MQATTVIKPYADGKSSLTIDGVIHSIGTGFQTRVTVATSEGQQSVMLEMDGMRAAHAALGAIIAAQAADDAREAAR